MDVSVAVNWILFYVYKKAAFKGNCWNGSLKSHFIGSRRLQRLGLMDYDVTSVGQ